MEFPFGRAALVILVLAILSGAVLLASEEKAPERPDLILATFARQHADSYREAVAAFEKEKGVKVQIQVVDQRALQSRLQASFQVGADVPDMVEVLAGSLGYFTNGPLEQVGFVDLTDRVKANNLDERLVAARFGIWSSRGHIFALPHDVHPVMLGYNRDVVEKLGIDVNELKTWDDFSRVGRRITKDYTGDGLIDHYMIDLQADGGDILKIFLLQRGGGFFDADGQITFNSELAVDTLVWYVKQIEGPTRISYPAGWGQPLYQALQDGLVVFIMTPDWRSDSFETDMPQMSGRMGLIPLPVWEEGGSRTSNWGGTGLTITKQCKDPDLAWELAMRLYYDPEDLGDRFEQTNILPPLKEAWEQPAFHAPRAYYGGQRIGDEYAALAQNMPTEHISPYHIAATQRFNEAFLNTVAYYKELAAQKLSEEELDRKLRDKAQDELNQAAGRLRRLMDRNVFLVTDTDTDTATPSQTAAAEPVAP